MNQTSSVEPVVFSFDIEEHHRIEAAVGLSCSEEQKQDYAKRMEYHTRDLLAVLAEHRSLATFFIVGELAKSHPQLVRDIAEAGHEIGSHSWDHQRVHRFTPESFAEDVRRSKEALEEVSGTPVVGYRAPTFSIVRSTGWALDVLAKCGIRYDSSIFPVMHDRYGISDAPRTPFRAEGESSTILELPPATLRKFGRNLPVAGGGYFRLFPLSFLKAGVRQLTKCDPAVGMLYFHPWEFDPTQPKLPLKRLSRWRTYVGIQHSRRRLGELLHFYRGRCRRAIDIVEELESRRDSLPSFPVRSTQ